MIKLIREHLSTKIFIITVCLLITVGGAIYGMVALGMSRSYFLELDRSLSNQTEKMVLQLSNTSVQEIDGILKMFALEHGISIVLKDSDEKVLGIYGDMEYSLAPGTDVEDILLGSGITESYSCKLTNGKTYWIHQLVENVIKEQEDMAIDRGLQFHIRIEESTWIRADEALFTKVISNVVGNAIKYTNEDGNIWVGVYKRGEEIIFWIENETESIDEKEIPKLCDAFYRIDKSRNKRTGGSGLGLYITKMILEQHQFPYCIENTEKGIKVEIRCYEPTRRLL